MFDRHHESGSAEAALCTAPVAVSLLDCGQSSMLADSFNGRDLLAFATCREQRAREHRRSVDEYGACSTRGIVTAALRSRELQVLAQGVEKQLVRLDCKFVRAPVDPKFEELFFHESATSC